MNLIALQLVCLATSLLYFKSTYAACSRKPQGATGDRSPVDDNFQIYIDGNPTTYIPGQQYNVSISCANGLKFISFTLVVESENSLLGAGYDMLGHFEIIDISETKFSMLCENMIESTNANTKSRIDVAWVAPTNPESGCVFIRAALLQHRNVWFIDDGFLSKRICPEEIDEINSQTPPMNPCCACDEAKYEIIIERKWSRNTHAKDFPNESWRTRFSELIGASHTFDYRFWEYGSRASVGLQELAEHGSTRMLESEIKSNTNAGSIRTIIKAPGILYRHNAMSTTFATVRVDPVHHVVSLVSKIYPSPDWILGVAGLELCLANCTWIERKVLNLYPWDVGTDAGATYMSPDQPQIPPDVVRRITSTFPSDHRSPFYDESGAPMKSLATLYLTRRKLYERECDFAEAVPLECATHPWNNWSDCSTKCGAGTQFRIRTYKDLRLAESFNCQLVLRQNQNCIGTTCGAPDEDNSATGIRTTAECELGHWSTWSSCSKRCGKGYATRRRDFVNPYARENCQRGLSVELEQSKECFGEDCGGSIRNSFNNNKEMAPQLLDFDEPGLMEEDLYNRPSYTQTGHSGANNRNQYEQPYERENQNVDEPGLMAENTYGVTPFNMNKPSQSSRFGIGNQQFSAINERQDLERQNVKTFSNPSNIFATNSINSENMSQSNIYGSEKLVGQNRAYGQGANLWQPQETPFQPIETSFNRFDTHSGRTKQSNRFSTQVPTTTFAPHKFSNQNSNFNNNYNNNHRQIKPNTGYDVGIREQYDEFGRKLITVEGGDPNNYAVVQEYCFEKPYPSQQPCRKSKVIVRNYWFYDAEDRTCKIFTTDNCDENKNKFRTLDACEGTCHRPQQILESTQVSSNGNNRDAEDFDGDGGNSFGNRAYGEQGLSEQGFGQPQSHVKANWRNIDNGVSRRVSGNINRS